MILCTFIGYLIYTILYVLIIASQRAPMLMGAHYHYIPFFTNMIIITTGYAMFPTLNMLPVFKWSVNFMYLQCGYHTQ